MPKDGSKTRLKILEKTHALVLEKGFAGTTIDHILEQTQLTKGAFFYHFRSKAELALGLITHYAKNDMNELQEALEETSQYTNDSAQRLLQFVQWFIDAFKSLDAPYPGCLYASYTYESSHFSKEIKEIVASSILLWRDAITRMIHEAANASNTVLETDAESLADHFIVILEGAFIISKSLNDPGLTVRQLSHYHDYLKLIFENGR